MFLAETTTTSTVATESTGFTWKWLLDKIVNWATTAGLRLLIALIILFVSFFIINFIAKRIGKRLAKRNADPTLSRVLLYVFKIGLKVLIATALVAYVGVPTSSISAAIAAVGLGIASAFNGTLGNVVGGIVIVVMRPFKLGDFITSNGQSGTVEDIKLFYTTIITPDNKVIFLPNGQVANNAIVNVSIKETRRVDVVFSVAYSTNVELAKNVIKKVAAKCPLILDDPQPFADITEYGDSSISITSRCWCKKADYWNAYFYMMNEVKNAFDENHIEIPFNQLDVTIKK